MFFHHKFQKSISEKELNACMWLFPILALFLLLRLWSTLWAKNYSYNYYIVSYSIFSIQDHSFPKNPQKCCSLPGGNEVSTMNAYMVQYMYTPLVAGCKHVQIRGFYVQCQTPASFSSVLATIDRAEVSCSSSGIFARSNYWIGLITGRYFLNMVEIA